MGRVGWTRPIKEERTSRMESGAAKSQQITRLMDCSMDGWRERSSRSSASAGSGSTDPSEERSSGAATNEEKTQPSAKRNATASTTAMHSNTRNEDEFVWIQARLPRSGVGAGVDAVEGSISACGLVRPFSQAVRPRCWCRQSSRCVRCLRLCVFNLIARAWLIVAAAGGVGGVCNRTHARIPSTGAERKEKKISCTCLALNGSMLLMNKMKIAPAMSATVAVACALATRQRMRREEARGGLRLVAVCARRSGRHCALG